MRDVCSHVKNSKEKLPPVKIIYIDDNGFNGQYSCKALKPRQSGLCSYLEMINRIDEMYKWWEATRPPD
jgi:hypothetical protein